MLTTQGSAFDRQVTAHEAGWRLASWRERGRLGYRAALWERSPCSAGGWRLVGTGEGRTRTEAEDAARVPQLEAA